MANPITISVKSRWFESDGGTGFNLYDIDNFGDFTFDIEDISTDFTVTRDSGSSIINGADTISLIFTFTLDFEYSGDSSMLFNF